MKVDLDPNEREKILRDLYSMQQASTDEPRALEDKDDPNWEEWLPGRLAKFRQNFFSRYEQYLLRSEHWADSNVEKLGLSTEI